MNRPFLAVAFRVWLTEILISAVNYFVLMGMVYEPLWGELRAHQIGMTTRIGYILALAWLLQRYYPDHDVADRIHAGILWLFAALAFEWGGSLMIQQRPVDEILVGWRIWDGYMWPYVLLAYLLANLLVGWLRDRRQAPA